MHEYIVAFYYLHVPLFFLTVQNFHKPKDPFLSHNPSAHSQLNHSALQQIHFFLLMEASVIDRRNSSVLTVYTGDHYIYVLILDRKQTGYSF